MAHAMDFSGVSKSHHSFLRMLPMAVRPEDFVVIKIEIDQGPEMQIVHTIADSPELDEQFDEIFFEYNFYFYGDNFGWGMDPNTGLTVDDAFALMTKLRRQ